MKVLLGALLIAGVILQPILGFSAIPEFFNQNWVAAILFGLFDGVLLVSGLGLIVYSLSPRPKP